MDCKGKAALELAGVENSCALHARSSCRGQAALELVAVIALLIVISAFLALAMNAREAEFVSDKLRMDASTASNKIAQEINTAAIVGGGYTHSFTLPATLAFNTGYNVSIENSVQTITVSWGEGLFQSTAIISSNVSGGVESGKTNTVKNKEGQIVIEAEAE